jgi:hypothetical protein
MDAIRALMVIGCVRTQVVPRLRPSGRAASVATVVVVVAACGWGGSVDDPEASG